MEKTDKDELVNVSLLLHRSQVEFLDAEGKKLFSNRSHAARQIIREKMVAVKKEAQ